VQLTVATDDGHAVVRVCDNGKGIERDALERVFDLFIQLEPNGGNALGGLGVGLALVRRIVELHGGRVQALSDGLGRGAEFVVRIPRSDDPLQISAGEPRPDVAMSASMRVMVVDDNVDAADSLALMLQQLGLDVRAVYDGSSALRIFDAFRPHLVLMDIGMPQMNGYEVARAMRNLGGGMKCMLAAVTGWGQDSDRARAKEAGFDRHCTKPLSDDTLRELLAEAAARHGLNSALR
jgi:CheY-like chemotaxis protein